MGQPYTVRVLRTRALRVTGPSLLLAATALLATPARANVVGVDAQNFNATTDGLDFVTVQSSQTLAPCIFNIGLFGNQAHNTLPLVDPVSGQSIKHTDSVTGGDINFGYGILRNWDFGLSLPQILAQTVNTQAEHIEFGQTGNTEVRLNTKVHFLGDHSRGLAVIGTLSFSRIKNDPYTGVNPGPTETLELAGDTTVGPMRLAANIGYRWRHSGAPIPTYPIEPFHNQYIYSAGANYRIHAINTKIIAEVFGSRPTQTVSADIDRGQSSLEALLGAKIDVTRFVALHFGGGTAITKGIGSPDWRIYAGVNVNFGPCFWCDSDKAQLRRKKPKQKTPEQDKEQTDHEDDYAAKTEPGNIPLELPSPAPKNETIVLEDVMFAFDKDNIVLPGTKEELKRLVDYMLKTPRYTALSIEGHTDNIGSDPYNQNLSERRANTIRRYLIAVFKLDPNSITAVGYGASRPVADNGNYQGRQRNRRVEFKIQR